VIEVRRRSSTTACKAILPKSRRGNRKIYGPDKPDTLTGFNHLTKTSDETGQFQEALA
jgi:hypothetical protein